MALWLLLIIIVLKSLCIAVGLFSIFRYITTIVRNAVYGKIRRIWEPFVIAISFSVFYFLNQL